MANERNYYVFGTELPDEMPQVVESPQIKEQKREKEQFRRVENPSSRNLSQIHEQKVLFKYVAAVCVFSFVMLCAVAYSFGVRTENNIKLQNMKETYEIEFARNKELSAELNALVVSADIDKIAVEELGLVKVTPENEFYLDSGRGNMLINND